MSGIFWVMVAKYQRTGRGTYISLFTLR